MPDFSYVSIIDYTSGNLLSQGTDGGVLSDPNPNLDGEFDLGESAGFWDYIGTVNINGTVMPAFEFSLDTNLQRYYDTGPVAETAPPTFPTVDPVSFPFCFAAGTLITAVDAERTVETLQIGDVITTADGKNVPVKWIGCQTVHKIFTPLEQLVSVRVSAGALDTGVPHTDLVLTAAHALIIDDFAIDAGALVNGTTITFEPSECLPDRVTYYHIETENHEVILANGVPAETFVDHAGRRAFDNFAEYLDLYGDEHPIHEMDLPRISAARLVPPHIRARLAGRKVA